MLTLGSELALCSPDLAPFIAKLARIHGLGASGPWAVVRETDKGRKIVKTGKSAAIAIRKAAELDNVSIVPYSELEGILNNG